MTMEEWVAALNARLKESEDALFTAAEKEAQIEGAVREYSRYRPRLFTAEVATVAGQQAYDLPSECLWVARVALPMPGEPAPGEASRGQRGWLEEGGQLWLFPPPDASGLPVRVTCAGAWAPANVPDSEAESVLIAAHARCCQALATDAARAFAFWVGDEKFDKSQVSEHYLALARELEAQLRARLRRG